ncbi:MAG: hypothetical protein JWQ66_1630 [Mucilaginibacter sp.]|nr:hypothetical protein [Mucilaginibacter sp.]
MIAYQLDTSFPNAEGFQFLDVSWLTLSPAGDELYILQRGAPAVSVWDMLGNHLRNWDTLELGCPHSLTFQSNNDGSYFAWITDMAPPLTAGDFCGHCIKQFDMNGNYIRSVGTCGENTQGTGIDPVQFDKVTNVAFDSEGMMWVTDGDINGLNNRVLQINPVTREVLQVWCAPGDVPGNGPGQFNLPHAVDIDAFDRVWIADALNNRIQVLTTGGTFLQQLDCFATDGVYGVCVREGNDSYQLITSSSPTSSPTGGTVSIFDVASGDFPVPNGCVPSFQWSIILPQGISEAMLHMVEATQLAESIFIAPLGGNLPPQKWDKVYLP